MRTHNTNKNKNINIKLELKIFQSFNINREQKRNNTILMKFNIRIVVQGKKNI